MNINRTIFEEIKSSLYKYDCHPDDFFRFLFEDLKPNEKQKEAIKIIDDIMTVHGKKDLYKYISELARVEAGIKELEPWVRDHVVHSVFCFILGIYINKNYLIKYYSEKVNGFQWKLAGLFHDIGYPIQIGKDILKPFTEKVEEIRTSLGIEDQNKIKFKLLPEGLTQLSHNENSLDLIQERLKGWGLNIDSKKEYQNMIDSGEICHGIISALVLFKVLDYIYEKYNPKREYKTIYSENRIDWNEKYFDEDIVSACSAIFIHNLDEKCFNEAKLTYDNAPVAFLLKLCDCLQEWERPSQENKNGISSNKFDIKINNNNIILETSVSEQKKKKIRNELKSYLDFTNIKIQ